MRVRVRERSIITVYNQRFIVLEFKVGIFCSWRAVGVFDAKSVVEMQQCANMKQSLLSRNKTRS